MSSDAGPGGLPERASPARRLHRWPVWMWALGGVYLVVGIALVVAVAGLLTPSGPARMASPEPSPASSSSPAPGPTLDAYGLGDPLTLAATPSWHAEPSARYRLTAAPDELRFVSDAGCRLSFRVGPLAPERTTASPAAPAGSPSSPLASPGSSPSPSDDRASAEQSATARALEAEIGRVRGSAAEASVTHEGFTVVTTLGAYDGPLVDLAGADLRVSADDGSDSYVRLGVRAVPASQAAVAIVVECPSAEEAATAMNHASVRAYLAAG
ncbi:hypothetical protein [Sinomonas halotolerans]|uniref:Uncharacterized protein n=1 Tax=Sinomonas halotolerans TaxID=1644133 RepID=A0ABU9WXZ6_9MICC